MEEHGFLVIFRVYLYEQVTKYRMHRKSGNKTLIYLLCMRVSRPLPPQLSAQNSMHTPHLIINAITQCMS